MEAQHQDVLQVEGHLLVAHQTADRHQAVAHRVHKVVLIVRGQRRRAAEDPIALARLGQESPNLKQIVAAVRYLQEPRWAAPVIPRVFVHELLNR